MRRSKVCARRRCVGVMIAGLLAAPQLVRSVGAADDALPPELRARVERLKSEVAAQPTTAETIAQRADVLWAWANAHALAGGVIPEDLPLLIRASRSADDPDAKGLTQYAQYFDAAVHELKVKDEIPNALGSLTLDRTEPLVAEDRVTLRQTWSVGAMPMVEGGAIHLGRDGFNNHGDPQVNDPAGDNYVTVTSSNPAARFVYQGVGLRQSLVTQILGIFRLEGATLRQGDTVTITYGHRSGGSRGFQVQSYSVSRCTFPVYLDLEAKGNFMQPAWPGVPVVGKREVAAVTVLVPSIVAPGEPFRVVVRSEDDRYNRASGTTPAYDVLLDGAPHSRIAPGSPALTVLEDVAIANEGVHRFEARSADGRIRGTSNPIWVRANPPHRVYWGDTHGHIGYSDAQGTPDGYFTFARDDSALDFVSLSEHELWTDDLEWRTLQQKALSYREDGRFIPILGYEWTVSPPGGHHNVFFRDLWVDRVGSQVAWLLPDLYRELRRRVRVDDALVIPHAHSPGNWQVSDPDLERLVEITSTHGTFEWFGNRYLSQGWEVGFVGSSDNHHEHPGRTDTGTTFHTELGGLAAVMAKEKTNDAIFSAMRDLAAYATGSRRIILDAQLNGAPMGTRLPSTDRRTIACRVMGTAPVEAIDVIKNGDVVYQKRYLNRAIEPRLWLRVGFSSSSEVATYKAPRNYRVWKGELEVAGARLVGVSTAGFEDPFFESAVRDGNRVEFTVGTRGRLDGLLLELDGARPGTAIRVKVAPGASGFPRLDTEAIDTTLRLADAAEGRLEQTFPVADPATGMASADSISLQVFDPADSLDHEFSYADLGPTAAGDYYYLRVTQVDGEQAWSSPWWVGGEAPSALERKPAAEEQP